MEAVSLFAFFARYNSRLLRCFNVAHQKDETVHGFLDELGETAERALHGLYLIPGVEKRHSRMLIAVSFVENSDNGALPRTVASSWHASGSVIGDLHNHSGILISDNATKGNSPVKWGSQFPDNRWFNGNILCQSQEYLSTPPEFPSRKIWRDSPELFGVDAIRTRAIIFNWLFCMGQYPFSRPCSSGRDAYRARAG